MTNPSRRCLSSLRLTRLAVLILGACLGMSQGVSTLAQPKNKEKRSEFEKSSPKVLAAFQDVVARPSESTVRVQCDGKDVALGTIVGPDGWILTKASELKGKITCKLKDGRELDARIVGMHEAHDLAMLKLDVNGLSPVQWTESKTAAVGSLVASPGTSPVAVGVVSVASRQVPLRSMPRNLTNSGFLGVSFDPAGSAAKIAQVIPDTPAAKAGLQVNDRILAIAGKDITDQEACINLISQHKPGDTVDLRIKRGDDELELKATLAKRPPNRGDFQNGLGSDLSEHRTGFPIILQHDSVLLPRDCGGPIVDLDGKTIGINIARAGRTESYAIPTEAILPLMADLKSGKLAPKQIKTESQPSAKVLAAREALRKAEAERAAAEKKVAEARDALERAEREDKAARKLEPKPKDE